MTLKELSQLHYLEKLIVWYRDELQKIEDNLGLGAMNYDGMPRNPSPKNKIEILTARKVDIQRELEMLEVEEQRLKKELEHVISEIGDYQIRLILLKRFDDLVEWDEVADYLGGKNTEDSVKKMCYRFIKRSESVPDVPNVPR